MTARYFDTHAHLQLREFQKDQTQAIERAREAGVAGMLVLGVDAKTSAEAVALARKHSGVFAAVGCHPHDAKDLTPADWDTIRGLARESDIVAIGEIGLDFYRDLSPRDVQVEALERQLELASALSKPVAVHCREANEALYPILESWSHTTSGSSESGRPLGVMHYFSGDIEEAYRYIELGFLISIHTSVTYQNAGRLQGVAAEIPLEWLVVETDSPYGAPQSKRGKRNEPMNVREAVEKVAELRGDGVEAVAQATTDNAFRLLAPTLETTQAAGSAVS